MLALAPGSVRLDAAEPGEVRPIGQIMPALRERGVRALSGNGVLGDPAGGLQPRASDCSPGWPRN